MKYPYIYWSGQCRKKVARKLRVTSVRAAHIKLYGLRARHAAALKPPDPFRPIDVERAREWPKDLLERYSFLRGGSAAK